MTTLRNKILILMAAIGMQVLIFGSAEADVIQPTVGFTARHIGNQTVVAGSGDLGFLAIKEGTSDRTCLEFNLSGDTTTSKNIYLNFYMRNLDDPSYSIISLYSYVADGIVNANDYYRTDNYILNFSDYGNTQVNWNPFSLNVTSIYNQSISNGTNFLGFLLKANDNVARYDLNYGDPNSELAKAISLANNPIPTSGIYGMTIQSGSDYSVDTHFGQKATIKYWFETDNSDNFSFDALVGGLKYTISLDQPSTGWLTAEFDIPSWLQNNDGSITFESNSPNNDAIVYLQDLPSSVPEPGTFLLLSLGLFGLGRLRPKFKD